MKSTFDKWERYSLKPSFHKSTEVMEDGSLYDVVTDSEGNETNRRRVSTLW